jgi:hypothetical protein
MSRMGGEGRPRKGAKRAQDSCWGKSSRKGAKAQREMLGEREEWEDRRVAYFAPLRLCKRSVRSESRRMGWRWDANPSIAGEAVAGDGLSADRNPSYGYHQISIILVRTILRLHVSDLQHPWRPPCLPVAVVQFAVHVRFLNSNGDVFCHVFSSLFEISRRVILPILIPDKDRSDVRALTIPRSNYPALCQKTSKWRITGESKNRTTRRTSVCCRRDCSFRRRRDVKGHEKWTHILVCN